MLLSLRAIRAERLMGITMTTLLGIMMNTAPSPAAGPATASAPASRDTDARAGLSADKWKRIESTTDQALAWLATQQQPDGSFQTLKTGQPGVTSLCVMAFLARGHLPGEGRYGQTLNRAIQYTIECQQTDGVFSHIAPTMPTEPLNASFTSNYNHPITGLMLSEAYGMVPAGQSRRIKPAVEKAIQYAAQRLPQPKRSTIDEGGWRYRTRRPQEDADLSITSWHLMFLRSAKNAGFEVPTHLIDEALGLAGRLYDAKLGTFVYGRNQRNNTRAMAGAGILSFSLGGKHGDDRALATGEFLLRHPLIEFNQPEFHQERYFYSTFYSSQAMFQLGGRYWTGFYPPMAQTLVANQQPDGSWEPDSHTYDGRFGRTCSTALAILSLSPPFQLLPIFQR